MKHYHVGNGKAVSLKIFRVVDIETGVNIFKGSTRRKLCGIDKLIVCLINHISRRLQAVVRNTVRCRLNLSKKSNRKRNRAKERLDAVFSLYFFTDYKVQPAIIWRYSAAPLYVR